MCFHIHIVCFLTQLFKRHSLALKGLQWVSAECLGLREYCEGNNITTEVEGINKYILLIYCALNFKTSKVLFSTSFFN